jgi:hypothetical protein
MNRGTSTYSTVNQSVFFNVKRDYKHYDTVSDEELEERARAVVMLIASTAEMMEGGPNTKKKQSEI